MPDPKRVRVAGATDLPERVGPDRHTTFDSGGVTVHASLRAPVDPSAAVPAGTVAAVAADDGVTLSARATSGPGELRSLRSPFPGPGPARCDDPDHPFSARLRNELGRFLARWSTP